MRSRSLTWPPSNIGRIGANLFLSGVLISALAEIAWRQLGGGWLPKRLSEIGMLFLSAAAIAVLRYARVVYLVRAPIDRDLRRKSVWATRRFWGGAALFLVGFVVREFWPDYQHTFPPWAILTVDTAGFVGILMLFFALSTKTLSLRQRVATRLDEKSSVSPPSTYPYFAIASIVTLVVFDTKWTTHVPVLDAAFLVLLAVLALRELVLLRGRTARPQAVPYAELSVESPLWASVEDSILAVALVWLVLGKDFLDESRAEGRFVVLGGGTALIAAFVIVNLVAAFRRPIRTAS